VVKPRISLTVKGSDKLGREAVDLAAEAGLELDDWQAYVLCESMKTAEDGRWAAREVGVNVARQNGKNAILEARELAELYLVGSGLTIHSAHNFDTAMEHFRRLRTLIEETPRLAGELARNGIRTSNGSEGFTLTGNRRLGFRTRTKGGGRGFACDLLVLDEAMFLPEMAMGALFPTKRARKNPQVWYTGSAVDQQIHEHGLVFAGVRKRGMEGGARLAYFEWSAHTGDPSEDDPAKIHPSLFDDPEAMEQANPALGIRIDVETMREERESLRHLPRVLAVELYGVGDWPDPELVSTSPIGLEAWVALEDASSRRGESVAFAFDVSPDGRGTIAVASLRADGNWHVEIVEDRGGSRRMPERITELVKRWKPAAVVCDGYGPTAAIIPDLERLNVGVKTLTAGEHASACARIVETLRHLGQPELTNAVRAAATRPLGDAWAWSRKSSSANISPLVSVTLALSAAMTVQPRKAAFALA
jgi:hypothetical protein